MKLEVSNLPNDVRCIRLDGDLDIAGVGAVETRFFAYCAGNPPYILVDLSSVGFLGSLGIRLLVQALKTVAARGGRLLLLNPTKIVHSALDISGLGQYVVRATEAEAGATLLNPGITSGVAD